MTYKEAKEYLYSLSCAGSHFGLDRIRLLLDRLGNPQDRYPTIHVAGTNGKGSVCKMLESIYRIAGYKTGMYTSPHLVYLGERIQVASSPISQQKIAHYTQLLIKSIESIKKLDPEFQVTFFEFMTAMAFLEFAKEKVDIAIIEVGLGGELDSTNVIKPEVSVITSISKDHTEILGDSIQSIARAKAGIIKEKVPLVLGVLPESAENTITAIANERMAPVLSIANHFGTSISLYPETSLSGYVQRYNSGIATLVTIVLKKKFPISPDQLRNGLMNTYWPGRWEKIQLCTPQTLILDATHNEGSTQQLHENLTKLSQETSQQFTFVVGVLGEERAVPVLKTIVPFAKHIYFVPVNQSRATDPQILKNIAIDQGFTGLTSVTSLTDLFGYPSTFLSPLDTHKVNDTIIVTGSIYLLGEVMAHLNYETGPDEFNLQDKVV